MWYFLRRGGCKLDRTLWVIAFWLYVAQGTPPQDLRYLRHQSWSTEEGLPQDSVHGIVQTGDGFLWIATEGGVARFDGVSFKTFDHTAQSAMVSDDACCLATDAEGRLWVGTADGLLLRKGQQFQRFGERDGLPSASIRALSTERGGPLLVVTAAGSARWSDGRFHVVPQAQDLPEGEAASRLGGVAEMVATVSSSPANPLASSLSSSQGSGGAAWAVSNTAVKVTRGAFSRQWKVGAGLPGSRVETLFVDREGSAWVGTNGGLVLLAEHGEAAISVPWLEGNVVLQVYEDREGNYWIGTETSGLHVLRPVKFRTEPRLADQALNAVVGSGGGAVWVGTRRDGLRLLRGGAALTPLRTEALTSPVILSLAPGVNGSVWAGTPDGLNHVEMNGEVKRMTSAEGLPDDYIQALASDNEGGVWVGTRRGLAHLHDHRVDVFTKADGLGGDLVGALLRATNGDLWVATAAGLSRRSADGGMTTYSLPGGSAEGVVTALAEGKRGDLWIGTSKGELHRWKSGALTSVPSLTGSLAVDGLVADDRGFLWLRTQRGLDRVALADLERCTATAGSCSSGVRHYGLADGLPSVEVAAGGTPVLWAMREGELWFTTRRGMAITDPGRFPANAAPPPVVIERFLADETPLDITAQPVLLPFGHVRFTIEYAGLSYTAPSEVRYRYKLEGLDPDWTDAGGRRSATYTNLRPREYRFRVQAMNNDGAWNEAGATLLFRIVPPFYRRWWFIALTVIAAAALMAGAYRLRLRRVKAQFGAVLKERNRMAREIHDTLAQDLVGVSLQLDIVSQLLRSQKVETAAQQVVQTRKLVTDGLAEARRSIWELRANLAEDSLPTRLAKVVERYSSGGLAIRLRIGGAYRKLSGKLEDEVLRVAGEALSNVQRHSGATEAETNLHYGSDVLLLIVEDRGSGFVFEETSPANGHYGVRGMGERASAIGAKLTVDSSVHAGTKVTLAVPIAAGEMK